jgi:hypothetical protein
LLLFFKKEGLSPRMNCTRFWLIRHAIVDDASRAFLYGRMDVPVSIEALEAHAGRYRALAARHMADHAAAAHAPHRGGHLALRPAAT